jgi:hypothetical protein
MCDFVEIKCIEIRFGISSLFVDRGKVVDCKKTHQEISRVNGPLSFTKNKIDTAKSIDI